MTRLLPTSGARLTKTVPIQLSYVMFTILCTHFQSNNNSNFWLSTLNPISSLILTLIEWLYPKYRTFYKVSKSIQLVLCILLSVPAATAANKLLLNTNFHEV
jgi:hypothetical protein